LTVLTSLVAHPPLSPVPGGDALFDSLEPLAGVHALVIGPGALEAVCGLIRGGCAAATELPTDSRLALEAGSADAAIVPLLGSLAEAREAVALAGRALAMGGRIVLRDTTGRLSQEVTSLLRAQGFCSVEAYATPEGMVLTAERPMFGPLHRG